MNTEEDEIFQFFKHEHLPDGPLKKTSALCADFAKRMLLLPSCGEKTAGMRKLLEAKDCFVRAALIDG